MLAAEDSENCRGGGVPSWAPRGFRPQVGASRRCSRLTSNGLGGGTRRCTSDSPTCSVTTEVKPIIGCTARGTYLNLNSSKSIESRLGLHVVDATLASWKIFELYNAF